MPELPDLQAISKNLNRVLKGKKVDKIRVVPGKSKIALKPLRQNLEGATIKKVYREGKELRFSFDNGNIMGMHLMLHGELNIFDGKNDHKHTLMEIYFTDGKGLALSDYQKQANVRLNPEESPAPDALSKELNLSYLRQKLATKKTDIKSFLMDQAIVRGIGNAYSDEILWKAGISPFSICSKIPSEKIKNLAGSIKPVLKNAEKKILRKEPDIISGEVRDFLDIHNAKKKKSPTGKPIKHVMLHSRVTYYTSEQEVFK